jgi:hypothetical protein
MKLIKDYGASMLVQLGDYDYTDNPQAFLDQFRASLGKRFHMYKTLMHG